MEEISKTEGTEKRNIPSPLLKVKDVATTLGIAPKTVNKLVRERKLGCVQVTETDRRFTLEQVQAYIEAQSTLAPIDRKGANPISWPKKGGINESRDEKTEDSWASLQKEMSRWM